LAPDGLDGFRKIRAFYCIVEECDSNQNLDLANLALLDPLQLRWAMKYAEQTGHPHDSEREAWYLYKQGVYASDMKGRYKVDWNALEAERKFMLGKNNLPMYSQPRFHYRCVTTIAASETLKQAGLAFNYCLLPDLCTQGRYDSP
jgi:hypothetical protein